MYTQEHSDSLHSALRLAGDFKFLFKNKTIVPQGKDFIILNNGIEYAKAEKQKMRSADPSAKTGLRESHNRSHWWGGGGVSMLQWPRNPGKPLWEMSGSHQERLEKLN